MLRLFLASLQHSFLLAFFPLSGFKRCISITVAQLLSHSLSNSLRPHGLQHARLPTWQADSLPSEPPGMPWILEWVAYPFPRASPQPRNQTRVYCLAGRFFTSWATREASPSTNIRAWNQQLYVKGISCCFYFSWDRGFSLAKAWFLNF